MSSEAILFAYAAPLEGRRVAALVGRSLEIGVGKAAAAVRLAEALVRARPRLVVLFGVCGAYPPEHTAARPDLPVGALCVVAESVLADEGVATPSGFRGLADLGLGSEEPFTADAAASVALAERLGGVPLVRAATVSTCSGTDALSRERGARCAAHVETMESAAAALACAAFEVPLVELRAVSNRTGARETAEWALAPAAERVQDAVRHAVVTGVFDALAARRGA